MFKFLVQVQYEVLKSYITLLKFIICFDGLKKIFNIHDSFFSLSVSLNVSASSLYSF